MAVAFGAIGAKSAGGTTTVSVAHPASVGAGDLLVAGRCLYQVAGIVATDETGWTAGGKLRGGTGTTADAHATMAAADYREAAGGETGSVTFDQGGTVAGALGIMARYTKGSGAWDVASATGDDATHAADRSVTSSTSIALAAGDVVVAVVAVDTDAALTITSPTFTASGITFGTVNRRTSGAGVITGNDGNIEVFDVAVSSGTATVAVTLAFTTATTQCGPVSFLRLRETAPTQQPASGTVAATSGTSGSAGLISAASGTVAATSATTGSSTLRAVAAGVVAGVTVASAVAVLGVPAAGSIVTTTATSGAALLAGAASGTVAGTSTTVGAASLRAPTSGSADGASAVTGSVAATLAATGAVSATSGTTGSAVLQRPAAGEIAAASEAAGTASARLAVAGLVEVQAGVSGEATARIAAAGTTAAVSTVNGSADLITAPSTYPASGTVSASSTITGEAFAALITAGAVELESDTTGSAFLLLPSGDTFEVVSGAFGESGDPQPAADATPTPLERSTTIAAENRSTVIHPDIRAAAVPSEPRTTTL